MELESYKPDARKSSGKKDEKGAGDSSVTYQLFYRPEQAKFSHNARVHMNTLIYLVRKIHNQKDFLVCVY